MKMFIPRKRSVVSLTLVLCATFVFSSFPGRRSEAENRTTVVSTDIAESSIPNSFTDLVPDNSAKIRFVKAGDLPAGRAGLDVSQMTPLTLASGDLNADGFPDLVCGYASPDGGLVIVHYGDARAYGPTDPADIRAAIENRFRSPFSGSTTIRLDHAPDFLSAGDFDRNGRTDILTAARGGLSLNALLTSEKGFTSKAVDLPGQLTALAVSEAYTPDGFADVYAGIVGGQLLAYEKSESILVQEPDAYSLPGSADAIVPGRFDGGTTADFAVLVSGQAYVVHGAKSSLTERVDLPFTARSIAAGDFIWDRDSRMELAVAAADGTTSIISQGDLDTRRLTADELNGRRKIVTDIRDGKLPASALSNNSKAGPRVWKIAEQTSVNAGIAAGGSPSLIPMLASGQQSVDLLALDPAQRRLSISYRTDSLMSDPEAVERESVSFQIEREPIAVLPMRLNVHGHASLVVFNRDTVEPELIYFAPEAIITVDSAADVLDAGGGACGAITIASLPGPNGVISLREAVCAANGTAGADTVAFAAALNTVPIQLTRVGDDNTNVNGDLDFNTDITLMGSGAANTLLQGSTNAGFTGNMGDKLIGINQDGNFTTLICSVTNLTVRFTRNDIAVNAGFTQTGGAMDIFLTGTGAMPGPTTTITNATFDSNASLHSYGGALNVDSGSLVPPPTGVFRGTVNISGSTFSNNDTLTLSGVDNPPSGGGINLFSDIDNVTISNSTITANQTSNLVTANGGGINMRHSFGGTIALNTTNVTNNIAGSDGGGFLTAFNQTLTVTGGSITGNTSTGTGDNAAGGGFVNGSNDGFPTTLTNVTITNNVATAGATGTGGGIVDGANSALGVSGCTITGNSADNGGGIAVVSTGGTQTLTLTNGGTFSGNTATNGSAAYVSAGILALAGTNAITGNINVITNSSAALTTNAASTTTLTGNLTMGAGAITNNATAALNIAGNYSQSGGTFNGGGTMTLTGTGNFTQSGGTFTGGSVTVNLIGNFSYTAGTFTGGTSTFNFNGSGAQSVSNSALITFNNISDANVTQPLTFNNSVNANGSLTANGAATILNPVAAAVIGGTGTLTGTGTARVTRATGTNDFLTQYTITNKTLTNLLIDYVGPGAQGISGTTYSNVRLNNASGGTLSAPATVNGTLTLQAGAFNVGTSTLTLNGAVAVSGGSLTSGATGTVVYNQSSIGQVVVAGTYGNLTFSNFNKVLPAAGTVFIAGTFTPGSASGHTITGSTIEFNGAGAQTIPAFNYNNLSSSGAGARTLANTGTIGIAGTFTPGANVYTITGSTIDFNGSGSQTIPAFGYNNLTSSGAGARTLSSTGTIRIAGVFTPGTNVYTIIGSTVEYNGAAAQVLPSTFTTYNNLTLNNITTVTGFAGLTVQGLLRVQAGTFTSSSTYNNVQIDATTTLAGTNATTINVSGNWTNNGTFTANGNTVNFNGTLLQTIAGSSATTFSNLSVNNASGITFNANATVNGVFTLQSGAVGTGAANILTLGTAATVNRTSGLVTGNLRKNFGGPGPMFEMPVGAGGVYSPLNVTVTLGSGQLTAKANTGVPAILLPNTGRTLQRYWTLSGSGIRSNLTFNYVDADVPGAPNNENIWNIIRVTGTTAIRYPPTFPNVVMDPANNRFSIGGVESYSDWTAGEPLAPTAANVSVSGQVLDVGGRGISGARVVMQGQDGTFYLALTNPFGHYVLDTVPAGQTYLVSVEHKRYQFTSQTISVSEDLVGLDFIGEPAGPSRTPSGGEVRGDSSP